MIWSCVVLMLLALWMMLSKFSQAGAARHRMSGVVAHTEKWQLNAVLYCYSAAAAAFWMAVESGLFALLLFMIQREAG